MAQLLFTTAPPPARVSGVAVSGLRMLAGSIWLYNVVWKVPPDFGENDHSGLYHFTHFAVDHPVFAPFSWVIEHVVLPNFTVFGWLTLIVETYCTPGSASGPQKRTGGNTGTALRADSTNGEIQPFTAVQVMTPHDRPATTQNACLTADSFARVPQ
jgi:hypothetical protein